MYLVSEFRGYDRQQLSFNFLGAAADGLYAVLACMRIITTVTANKIRTIFTIKFAEVLVGLTLQLVSLLNT